MWMKLQKKIKYLVGSLTFVQNSRKTRFLFTSASVLPFGSKISFRFLLGLQRFVISPILEDLFFTSQSLYVFLVFRATLLKRLYLSFV